MNSARHLNSSVKKVKNGTRIAKVKIDTAQIKIVPESLKYYQITVIQVKNGHFRCVKKKSKIFI